MWLFVTDGVRGESPTDDHDPEEMEEYQGATATEIQNHKALSEEARKVYTDLHLEDPTEGHKRSSNKEHKWKNPVKRKAPKPTGRKI